MSLAAEVPVAAGAGRELLQAAATAERNSTSSAHAREYRFEVIAVLCVVTRYRVLGSDVIPFLSVHHRDFAEADVERASQTSEAEVEVERQLRVHPCARW